MQRERHCPLTIEGVSDGVEVQVGAGVLVLRELHQEHSVGRGSGGLENSRRNFTISREISKLILNCLMLNYLSLKIRS